MIITKDMNKKVLLLMTSYYSINKMIILNMEKMGYKVTYIKVKEDSYRNIKQRVHNFFRKTFLGDKTFKDFLRKKNIETDIINAFRGKNEYFDYALVIRPDFYTKETIQYLKKYSKKIIAYQWDGFSRFEVTPDLINIFDVFGVFDEQDYKENINNYPNLVLTHNFYFDFLEAPKEKNIDILYIGANEKGRYKIITHICNLSKDTSLKNYFRLYNLKEKVREKPIMISHTMLSYKEVLELSSKSKAIIDIKYPAHNGLSLRFFEALYFSQKIITDNKTVKQMDFYNSNNILVVSNFEKLTKSELEEFLMKEYIEIPKEIKEKYSFESWFNTMIS